MIVTRIKLKNWRNFKYVDVPLRDRAYLIGPNASGKSNFLDVFRFLRDISNPSGGGLQKAVSGRGSIKKIRWLPSRDAVVSIEIHLAPGPDDEVEWTYTLAFRSEGTGRQRPIVTEERVYHHGEIILDRPDLMDGSDAERLTQTHLEQISANGEFRRIAETFDSVTYLHLVPQLLKFSDQLGGNRLSGDPFGQEFLNRIAKCTERTRDARLRKIQKALLVAVPQFEDLKFVQDTITGRPHLEARYKHWRPKAGLQREDEFSDGTLRLLGLMWSLLDGDSMLLLEEPELSLNDGIVSQIPMLISGMQRKAKHRRQVVITTHSEALLSNEGIDGREVVRLEPTENGTEMLLPSEEETVALKAGLTPADVMLSKTRPHQVEQLSLLE
ncbi:MAG: AAA family ATPase [Mariprofundus sp.]|nr:AAA family ATPase [Mariprofundus sp.]